MNKLFVNVIKIILVVLNFFLLSSFILLFNQNFKFDLSHFFDAFPQFLEQLIHIDKVTFKTPGSYIENPLLSFIIRPWRNSMLILFLSIMLGSILSIFCVVIAKRFKVIDYIMKHIVKILGYLPDIFYIPCVIVFIIFFYQQTGILIMEVASYGEQEAIVFPSIMLSVIPFVQLYKILDQVITEELDKDYVVLARAKGLNDFEILLRHVLSNVWITFYINFKQVVWMTLSSLLIMEVILGYFGATQFLYYYHAPIMLMTILVLMFVPIYLVLFVIQKLVEFRTGVKL